MKRSNASTLLGTAVGNFFEWLDFTIYGFFATAISLTLFPKGDEVLALIATVSAFAIGFITRPLGAYVMGRYADTVGRKNALVLTFALMGIGTVLIVAAPNHATAGLVGACCVLLGRLLQGFAASGEYGAAAAMFLEVAPEGKKGQYGSLLAVSTYLALSCGALLAVAIYYLFGTEVAESYGWRYAFIVGLCIIPVGVWIRLKMGESTEFEHQKMSRSTDKERIDWKAVFIVIGLTSLGTSSLYLSMIFMPSFAKAAFGIPVMETSMATGISCLVVALFAYIGGCLSDRAGGALPMLTGLVLTLLGGMPTYLLILTTPGIPTIFLFQCMTGIGLGLFIGGSFSTVCTLFLTSGRALGMGLGYNLGVAFFGAFAPIVSTAALKFGINYAPIVYLAVTSVISIIATIALLSQPVRPINVRAVL